MVKCLLMFIALLFTVSVSPEDYASRLNSWSGESDPIVETNHCFQIGEELVYNVSYASFDIGQVRVTLLAESLMSGKKIYKAVAHIDSYKGIPFVDLHAIYETNISEEVYSLGFHSRTKKEESWQQFFYHFDYAKRKIFIEHYPYGSRFIDKRDTVQVDTAYQDGLSLFYFARTQLHSGKTLFIPTVVSEAKGTTTIDFREQRTEEEIDAVKYPIDVVHFEGEAGFVGIFGLTGGFEGWFSNDSASVPILAKMKVILGSVRIELMRWKRSGWDPPRSPENRR